MAVPGPFKVVLQALERRHSPDTLGDPTAARAKVELARLFDLDEDTASNIIAAMPIVVVDGLDGRGAGVVRDRLRRLADLGCKVVVTDEAADTIPRVNWPELPAIARVADEVREAPAHGHGGGGGLACPACGAALALVAAGSGGAPAPRASASAPPASAGGANGAAAPARAPDTAPSRAAREPASERRGPPAPAAHTDDWLDPPVGAGGPPPPTRTAEAAKRGSGRFDDASLLALRGGSPAAAVAPAAAPTPLPPPPPPPPRDARPGTGRASAAPTRPPEPARAEPAELDVSFTESSEQLQGGPPPATAGRAVAAAPAPAPARTAAAPSRPSEPDIDVELLDSGEAAPKKKGLRFDDEPAPSRRPAADPFDLDADDPLANAFPEAPPKAAAAARASQVRDPFEDSRIVEPSPAVSGLGAAPPPKGGGRGRPAPARDPLEDSGSDILDATPPHRRGAATASTTDASRSASSGLASSGGLDADLDLLGDDPRLLDSDEPVRRGGPAAKAAPPPAAKGKGRPLASSDDGGDPFEASVVGLEASDADLPAPARPAPGKGSGKRPSIEDVLDMFGPEDEVPLDDGDGLDPPGLDLSPGGRGRGGAARAPSGERSGAELNEVSDILEPLDPGEALQIIKTTKPPRPGRSSQSGVPAVNGGANGRGGDGSDPSLEALDANEALAILNPGSDPKKKKTRGVPFPASGEDLFEDSSRGKPAKKKTDPFARARKQLASEEDVLEASPPRPAAPGRKPDSDRRPARGSAAELDAVDDAPPARASKPARGPAGPPPSKGGDGDHGLVLSRIADPEKKEEAAGIIAEVKGCSVEEARRLTDRTIIPVLKGVSREEAEHHLEKFKKVKIAGRVTTRQRS